MSKGKVIQPEDIAKAGTEHAEQCAFFQWAAINSQIDSRLQFMFAIPNGGLRSKATASRLKAEGAKAGVCDVMLPIPASKHHGLFVEMKLEKYRTYENGGCSEEQIKWIKFLKSQNYRVEICYSWLDAANVVCEYLSS